MGVNVVAPKIANSQEVSTPKIQASSSEKLQWYPFIIRNVKPSFLAWKIDPVHNKEPSEEQDSNLGWMYRNPTSPFSGKSQITSNLPPGVQAVVPANEQKTLLAYTSEDGLRTLQEIINVLDRPLRQVSIDVQFVQIEPEELLAFSTNVNRGAMGFIESYVMPENYAVRLQHLVEQKKAKILSSPSVLFPFSHTLGNNRSMVIGWLPPVHPIAMDKDEEKSQALLNGKSYVIYRATTACILTATINLDETVTILIDYAQVMRDTKDNLKDWHPEPENVMRSPSLSGVLIVRNGFSPFYLGVKDGETTAFYNSMLFGVRRTPLRSDTPPLLKSRRPNSDVNPQNI